MWNGDALDLDAYLAHLGHDGDRTPSLATLRALHRAHVLSVRWENLEAVLRKSRPLDVPSVQARMIGNPRGGTCFEHVTLYAAALERLGFEFFVVQGRVELGSGKIRPETHAMAIVELEGKRWLSDVGFGTSPLELIELTDATDVSDGVWEYRLRRQEVSPGEQGWALYQPAGEREGSRRPATDGWSGTPSHSTGSTPSTSRSRTTSAPPARTRPSATASFCSACSPTGCTPWTTVG